MKKELLKEYPPFSVLLSVYKKENPEFLDKALLSIENQTVLPKEIVLVEDGVLTSELEKVISEHKKRNIVSYIIVTTAQNNGLAAALRLGTKYISTEWIARMDSDDYSVEDRFEKQLDVIKNDPDLVVVGGQIKEFATNINSIVGNRIVPTTEAEIKKFIKWRNPFNHPTVMIRKKILERVGGYIPFGNLEDYYLWVRIVSSNYKVINIPDFLVYMRVDGGMYDRRGKLSNIKYFYDLRSFLENKGLISLSEKVMGNVAMTMNIVIPSQLRKMIYQNFLHKNRRG
ncbi:glycosyltransferase [Limosilactobacillus reuteri]|uniref:glycosyltransferase n=1 Tax=Limosilactobacillus reuteri TaxID=1598 RepID=UPI00214C5632|nr:glycosyltransferase [Limosilactobacillus reuteri]MCR1879280.1 glycosyltransferase [Limosilactobacillus reuteri]